MALNDIRESAIPIELDRPRALLYDMNGLAELEDRYGSMDDAFKALQKGSIKAARTLLWIGLLHEDETLTERQAGALVSMRNMTEVMAKITSALTNSTPEPEGEFLPGGGEVLPNPTNPS